MSKKPNPMIQRLLGGGDSMVRGAIREETRERVEKFQDTWSGAEPYVREEALHRLCKEILSGQEDLLVLQGLVQSGTWLLELEHVTERIQTERARKRLGLKG